MRAIRNVFRSFMWKRIDARLRERTVEMGQEWNIMESLTLRIEWSTRVHWFFTPWNHPDPLRPPSRKKRNERIYLAGDAAGVAFRSNCAKWAPRVSPASDGLTNQAENWILGAPVALCSPLSCGCGCPTDVYVPHIHGSEQPGVSGRPFTIVSHHHAALLLSFRFATPFFRPLNNKIPRCSSPPSLLFLASSTSPYCQSFSRLREKNTHSRWQISRLGMEDLKIIPWKWYSLHSFF